MGYCHLKESKNKITVSIGSEVDVSRTEEMPQATRFHPKTSNGYSLGQDMALYHSGAHSPYKG
jgi:hypothetical protein